LPELEVRIDAGAADALCGAQFLIGNARRAQRHAYDGMHKIKKSPPSAVGDATETNPF